MKKLLVLVLVLGMASLANAGIVASVVTGSNPAVVEIQMDYTGADFYTAIVSDGAFTLTANLAAMPDASGEVLPSIFVDDGTGAMVPAVGGVAAGFDGPVWTIAAYSTGVTKPQAVFFTLTALEGTKVQVLNVDGEMNSTVAAEVLVPEPATMAILGLGALLIRRKK